MVFVPGGIFTMGNDGGTAPEAPAHKVRLSPYYIDQHEVTAGQFRLFLEETHYRGQPPGKWSEDFKKDPSDAIPMVMVDARDAAGVRRLGPEEAADRGPVGDGGPGRPTAGSSPGAPDPIR